jgi:hypothetical protein
MLTAWGFASAFGPLLIAHMRETGGSYRGALHLIAGVMAVSTLLPILVRPPRTGDTGAGKMLPYPGRCNRWAYRRRVNFQSITNIPSTQELLRH